MRKALLAGAVAVCGGLLLAARRRFVVVRVTGPSMLPTYRPGDRVLVRRTSRPAYGQVVVFERALRGEWRTGPLPAPQSSAWVIKRVIALPGDPVPPEVAEAVDAKPDETVPPERLVVRGDGAQSADSRVWGYLPADRVLGVVVRKLLSSESESE